MVSANHKEIFDLHNFLQQCKIPYACIEETFQTTELERYMHLRLQNLIYKIKNSQKCTSLSQMGQNANLYCQNSAQKINQ